MMQSLLGRENELRTVDGFLSRILEGPASLILEGEQGIGKTSLWEAGIQQATARGYRVLSCRAVEAEARLSFAAVADLIEPVLQEMATSLRPPRRRALAIALLLEDPGSEPLDQRTIGAALVDALRQLASGRPLVVGIDDLQWLDTASAHALQFALRRVGSSRIGLLATVRGERIDAPIAGEDVTRLRVGPLSQGAVHRLLKDELGLSLARPELNRLANATGGNPLYALELGRELVLLPERPRGSDPLPVPHTFQELVRERVRRLSAGTQDVLLSVGTAARPTVGILTTIHGPPTHGCLDEALGASVIELDGTRVRFSHPLFATACYGAAPIWERRASHGRLAGLTSDPEERARHLALACGGVDGNVATTVADAAEYAADRGRTAAAGELLELAAELTPVDSAVGRARQLRAATFHRMAGDRTRAGHVLDMLLADATGDERADVLLELARTRRDSVSTSIGLCECAVEATADPARVAEIFAYLSFLRILAGDVYGALRAARAGLECAETLEDPELLARALGRVASAEQFALEITPGLLERGVELENRLPHPLGYPESPTITLGRRLSLLGQVDRAREALSVEERRAEALGDEGTRGQLLFYLTILEWQSGRWSEGLDHCAAALELAEQLGDEQFRGMVVYGRAAILGRLGDVDEARALAAEAASVAETFGDATFPIWIESLLGFLEQSLGNLTAAAEHLRPLPEKLLEQGWNEPGDPWPETIEVLVALGELETAADLLRSFDSLARRLGAEHAFALAARCRGLLEAATGDVDGALRSYERALGHHARSEHLFEFGRTLLVAGACRRRARQKTKARAVLDQALGLFTELGARLWVARTHEEISRIAGRRPGDGSLTRMEAKVVELAAAGHSNKEIAGKLFISVHTVEAHLTHSYRKLGVRSRTDLMARSRREPVEPKM
jgi:DNA-binding CsgD family transcriptional regulator